MAIKEEDLKGFTFTPIKEGEEEGGKTAEQLAQEEESRKLAGVQDAAGGADGEEDKGGKAGDEEIDHSLLEGADPTLVSSLEEVLKKEESELTEAELKQLEDNEGLVKAIVNKDLTVVGELMQRENFIQEGEFEDTADGVTSYLEARDKERDKNVINDFLGAYPEMNDLYQHTVVDKNPINTFLMQQQKPAILDMKIEKVTESLSEEDKNSIITGHESIIRANLLNKGMDEATVSAVIEGAKAKGTTELMATTSLAAMNETYNKLIENQNNTYKTQLKAQQDAVDKEREDIKTVIRGGKLLSNVTVPKSEEANFIKYMTAPINEKGETMADLKYNKLSLAQRSAMDYFIFKDFKLPIGTRTSVAEKFKVGNRSNANRKMLDTNKGGQQQSKAIGIPKTKEEMAAFFLGN